MWSAKPEVLIYVPQYDRCHCNFNGKSGVFDYIQCEETDPGRLRRRTTTGNSNVATKTGYTYISGTMTDRMTIPTAKSGFSTTPSAMKLTPGDCKLQQRPTTGNCNIDVLLADVAISGNRSLSQ